MLAANFKRPITSPAVDEGGAYGAAMLAALGAGAPPAEVWAWATAGETIEPDESEFDRYDAKYEQFKALYQDLKSRFAATDGL
jgi:xylulokinase